MAEWDLILDPTRIPFSFGILYLGHLPKIEGLYQSYGEHSNFSSDIHIHIYIYTVRL